MAVASQACRVASAPGGPPVPELTEAPPTAAEVNTPVVPIAASRAAVTPAVSTRPAIATPTPGPVSISAVGGDLAIRTGPATVFDAIDVLKDGHSLPVYARSIQDGWLQVPMPSQPGQTGWISSLTGYSQVQGYVLDLPMIATVEWPFGGYLRNCTSHSILVQPGDVTLQPAGAAPANRVWFYPGLYTLYDVDLAGRPEIMQVALREHTETDIHRDGAGTKSDCP